MVRIDTTTDREKWQFACPHRKRHRDWRVVDGLFECRSCRDGEKTQTGIETETVPAHPPPGLVSRRRENPDRD